MNFALYCIFALVCLGGSFVHALDISSTQADSIYKPCKTPTMEVLSWSPRIFLFRDFLEDYECEYFIMIGAPQLKRSRVVGGEVDIGDSRRTSSGMFFPIGYSDFVLERIENRISHLTFIPRECSETIQVVHYLPGQEYQPHYDYFDSEFPASRKELERGGQRLVSFLMYLNTPEEGGETVFPLANISVQPKKGDALMFFDCDLDGDVDPLTLHAGAPVIKGEKWLATKWLHPRPFH